MDQHKKNMDQKNNTNFKNTFIDILEGLFVFGIEIFSLNTFFGNIDKKNHTAKCMKMRDILEKLLIN